MLGAREVRHDRPAAHGDQDLVGGEGLVLADQFDGVGVAKLGPGMRQLGAGVGEIADVDPRQPGDLHVLLLQEGLPVEAEVLEARPAVALGHVDLVADLRGVDHELLGDAAADHAGAAHPVLLGHGHPSA